MIPQFPFCLLLARGLSLPLLAGAGGGRHISRLSSCTDEAAADRCFLDGGVGVQGGGGVISRLSCGGGVVGTRE